MNLPIYDIEPTESTTIRTAVVVVLLMVGRRLKTAEVAEMTGMSREGAYRLMCKISSVMTLTLDDDGWQVTKPYNDALP